jgi:hypothetical protein
MNSKLIIILITILSLTGCTSMRAMDHTQVDFVAELETGDHLVVYEKGGRVIDMTFTQVEGDRLVGSVYQRSFETVEVEIDDILQIEIEKISGAKTTGAVVGGIILAPIVAVGFGLAAFAGG